MSSRRTHERACSGVGQALFQPALGGRHVIPTPCMQCSRCRPLLVLFVTRSIGAGGCSGTDCRGRARAVGCSGAGCSGRARGVGCSGASVAPRATTALTCPHLPPGVPEDACATCIDYVSVRRLISVPAPHRRLQKKASGLLWPCCLLLRQLCLVLVVAQAVVAAAKVAVVAAATSPSPCNHDRPCP